MAREKFTNALGGTLAFDITSTDTSFQLTAGGGNGLPTNDFRMVFVGGSPGVFGYESLTEVVYVTTRSGDSFSGVIREHEITLGGGAKAAWTAGTYCVNFVTAGMVDNLLQIEDVTASLVLDLIKTVDGAGSGLDADLLDGQHGAYYAPIASPTFTGDPKCPTPAPGDNDTSIANTAFIQAAIAAISIPSATYSLGIDGWLNFPVSFGGMQFKWGKLTGIAGSTSGTITYPTAFPNHTISITFFEKNESTAGLTDSTGYSSYDATGVVYSKPSGRDEFTWFAIGY